MNSKAKLAMIAAAAALAAGLSAALLVESGFYNIGADDHHPQPMLSIMLELRERSIAARLDSVGPQPTATPEMIGAGAEYYAALCVGCHLAPGVTKSEIRAGLYPHPANLAQQDIQESRRAFSIIKHGIKMSAMPAWGKTLDDAAVWDGVAFLRKMPTLLPQDYQRLLQRP